MQGIEATGRFSDILLPVGFIPSNCNNYRLALTVLLYILLMQVKDLKGECVMEQQFSPGLLYSVAPENFSELHLQEDAKVDQFEWEKQESAINSLAQTVLSFFHKPAAK
ncbi:MAG: hypothetical protein Q7T38_10900 [Gallionella sp.]|nr:hypothetical protein [Gallionella sp.]